MDLFVQNFPFDFFLDFDCYWSTSFKVQCLMSWDWLWFDLGDYQGLRDLTLRRKTKQATRVSNGFGLRAKAALRSNNNKSFVEIPNQWYNLVADLSVKPPPPLHPKTFEPIKPEDLSHLFPNELIKQEATQERFIDIPEEVLEIYKLWRPTPLIRFLFFLFFGNCFFLVYKTRLV